MNTNRMNSESQSDSVVRHTTRLTVGSIFVLTCLLGCIGCLGCYRSTVVPPSASIDRPAPINTQPQPQPQPNVIPTVPTPLIPESQPVTPITRDNPWKPNAAGRDWKYIVLHHTATKNGDVESIHESHLKNKDKNGNPWLGIGYHFVIGNGNGMNDGDIEPTFRWRQQIQGAHAGVSDYNQHGIGICLVGNFDDESPTKAQITSVKRLVRTLAKEYEIAVSDIIGHGDVKATECPGSNFPLSDVRDSAVALSFDGLRQQLRIDSKRQSRYLVQGFMTEPLNITGQ